MLAASYSRRVRWSAVLGYLAALFVSNVFHFHNLSGRSDQFGARGTTVPVAPAWQVGVGCGPSCWAEVTGKDRSEPAAANPLCRTEQLPAIRSQAREPASWVLLDCPSCQFLALKSICQFSLPTIVDRFAVWGMILAKSPLAWVYVPSDYDSRAPPTLALLS